MATLNFGFDGPNLSIDASEGLLADAEAQPGAALNYGWYARNTLTFSKLAAVTEPGVRVIVLYGSGHAYPGFSGV